LVEVHSLDERKLDGVVPIFVTLTYPMTFPEPADAKRHLRAVFKRFERQWGGRGGWWKLEPQKRGAPHFHIVLFLQSQDPVEEIREWWPVNWHEIAGGDDPNHLRWHRGQLGGGNKHCAEVVSSKEQLLRYLGKYVGKVCEGVAGWTWPGRFWGYVKRPLVKSLCSVIAVDVEDSQAIKVGRTLRRYRECQPTMRVKIRWASGRVARRWVSASELRVMEQLRAEGAFEFFRYRVRMRWRGRVGVTAFLRSADALRLLKWAGVEVGGEHA
jgi:hypothetical protein